LHQAAEHDAQKVDGRVGDPAEIVELKQRGRDGKRRQTDHGRVGRLFGRRRCRRHHRRTKLVRLVDQLVEQVLHLLQKKWKNR